MFGGSEIYLFGVSTSCLARQSTGSGRGPKSRETHRVGSVAAGNRPALKLDPVSESRLALVMPVLAKSIEALAIQLQPDSIVKFSRDGLVQFLDIDPIALGNVQKGVFAVVGGSPIGRIKQTDFEQYPAQF